MAEKEILELLNEWQNKAAEAYQNYQIDGLKKFYTQYKKYDKLVALARKALSKNEDEITRAVQNQKEKVRTELKNLFCETYTKEQVTEILYRIIG